jgi:hypothetical protein
MFPPGPSRGQEDLRELRVDLVHVTARLNQLGHHLTQYVHLAGGCDVRDQQASLSRLLSRTGFLFDRSRGSMSKIAA